jgi:hypothetical protein
MTSIHVIIMVDEWVLSCSESEMYLLVGTGVASSLMSYVNFLALRHDQVHFQCFSSWTCIIDTTLNSKDRHYRETTVQVFRRPTVIYSHHEYVAQCVPRYRVPALAGIIISSTDLWKIRS